MKVRTYRAGLVIALAGAMPVGALPPTPQAAGSQMVQQPFRKWVLTGSFTAPPVQGLSYTTSSGLTGMTNTQGQFQYRPGDRVDFRIGRLSIGSCPGSPRITPVQLFMGASTAGDPRVVRLLQALQTLDEDGNASNGILIPPSAAEAFTTDLKFADVTDVQVQVIDVACQGSSPRTLLDSNTALLNYASSLTTSIANPLDNAIASLVMAGMGTINNFVIGGGLHTCSSFNGDGTVTPNLDCKETWPVILSKDSAFRGRSYSEFSFLPTSQYPMPSFALNYSITQERIDTFASLPSFVIPATTRDAMVVKLNARLSGSGSLSALTWDQFDGGNPMFVDGYTIWNGMDTTDWRNMCNFFTNPPIPSTSTSAANGAYALLSPENIAAYAASAVSSETDRQKVMVVLNRIVQDYPAAAVSPGIYFRRNPAGTTVTPNFRGAFIGYSGATALAQDGTTWKPGITSGLTTDEVAALRTTFVDDPVNYTRPMQARSIKYSVDENTRTIYSAFVAAARKVAGGAKPRIGFVTAATANPMGDFDINYWALKSAGAEPVWIPLDGGMRKMLDGGIDTKYRPFFYTNYANYASSGGYFNAEKVWPDLASYSANLYSNGGAALDATLNSLHGIMFMGGDQSRILDAYASKDSATGRYTLTSHQLNILQTKLAANQLVVSGTSAGGAIQSGGVFNGRVAAMIAGGESELALQAGFSMANGPVTDSTPTSMARYYPEGGGGFFKYGILDTHFSVRAREGRLIRLTKESNVPYGFGVDENTSLVVGKPDSSGKVTMTPLGAGGVFVVDNRQSEATTSPFSIRGVTVHYLLPGDKLELDADGAMKVTLSPVRAALPVNPGAETPVCARVQEYGSNNFRNLTILMGITGATKAAGGTNLSQGPNFTLTLNRTPETNFRSFFDGRVAYTHLKLDIE